MIRNGKNLVIAGLLMATLSLTGCAAALIAGGAAAGAGGVMYVKGDLEKVYANESINSLYAASKAGLSDMEFTPKSDQKDALQFKVVYEMADGTDVTVMGKDDEGGNRLSIRVGVFGDKDTSMRILDAIESHL